MADRYAIASKYSAYGHAILAGYFDRSGEYRLLGRVGDHDPLNPNVWKKLAYCQRELGMEHEWRASGSPLLALAFCQDGSKLRSRPPPDACETSC